MARKKIKLAARERHERLIQTRFACTEKNKDALSTAQIVALQQGPIERGPRGSRPGCGFQTPSCGAGGRLRFKIVCSKAEHLDQAHDALANAVEEARAEGRLGSRHKKKRKSRSRKRR